MNIVVENYDCILLLRFVQTMFLWIGPKENSILSVFVCRLRGIAFQASIHVVQTRAVILTWSAVMASGTALEGEMRKIALCARRASIPARVAAGYVTLPLRDVTTRRSAQMARMRKTASIVNPETSIAEPTCASLRHGGVTGRRTVWMAVMKETVCPLCPGRWSQQLWLAVWSVDSCWSLHWVVPLNCTRSGPESIGEIISFIFLPLFKLV